MWQLKRVKCDLLRLCKFFLKILSCFQWNNFKSALLCAPRGAIDALKRWKLASPYVGFSSFKSFFYYYYLSHKITCASFSFFFFFFLAYISLDNYPSTYLIFFFFASFLRLRFFNKFSTSISFSIFIY